MKTSTAAQPFFLLFLGLILAVTLTPPVLGLLGATFSSPTLGGTGTHVAGVALGGTMLRLDLPALGFAFLIALLAFLYDRATGSRFSRLLGLTVALFGLADGVHLVRGMVLPAGSVTYYDATLIAAAISRLGGACVLALGCTVIRWGSRVDRRASFLMIAMPGGAVIGTSWWAMLSYTQSARLPLLDLNLVALAAYGLGAACLRAELRHHRLRFFGRGVLTAFIPLAAGQVLLTFAVQTVVDDAYHMADLLRLFAWLIPAAGLGIDYVNSFYARDVSLEMRYLRAVIDSVPHYIFARDTRGRFTLVNQAVADFYGLRVHEIEGRHLMDVHPQITQCQEWLAEDKETLARGEKVFLPGTVATRCDGHDIWINSIKTPLRSRLGVNDQVLGVSIDVSEQRRAEKALAEALDAAKESSRAKSEFLANMSHEIRTPMNCIIGLADLLKDMDGDARHRQYLDMIRMSGSSLLTLINDILDISKIEAGQLELDLVDTDLQTLVEDTAALIAFSAQSKGLEMICRVAPGLPARLRLDPGRLRQVLTNLLNNAAKFTREGHILLDINPIGERDGQLELCFRVTDTGIGIEPENLHRIFDKFTQAEAGTTRRFGGTGLGLSISQHLVRLMSGRITADSAVGVGTTFSFTIPAAPAAEVPTTVETQPPPGRRVLIVTDHPLGGNVLAEKVRRLGATCRIAVGISGMAAELAPDPDRTPWDLVLADQFYFEDGHRELHDHLDRLAATARPRVVLLNTLTHLPTDDELAELGCNGALSKPVRLGQLAAVLSGQPPTRGEQPEIVDKVTVELQTSAPPTLDPERLEADPDRGPHVLLAEDNPFNQKVAVAMLRLLGCRVDVAATGVRALDLAGQDRFDLVLMDCQMPVMDGYEATRRIRQLPGDAGAVTIIAMTANALSGDREACLAVGMDDFLSKPITRQMLQEMLAKWDISGEKTEAPEAEPPTVAAPDDAAPGRIAAEPAQTVSPA